MCESYIVGGTRKGIKARNAGECAWCFERFGKGDEISVCTFQHHDEDMKLGARRYHPECEAAMQSFFVATQDCYYPPMKRGLAEEADQNAVAIYLATHYPRVR